MITKPISKKHILLFVIFLSSILVACGTTDGMDPDTLMKLTQTATAGTQTAAVSVNVCDQASTPTSVFWIYQDATSANNHFVPSGYMGDVGDIVINESHKENPCSGETSIEVVYKPEGKGPNSCDYSAPCKWAGVYWLQPANNWGQDAMLKDKGFDLTGNTRLVFWARAEQNSEMEFKTGGVVAPYGDSLEFPRATIADLTKEWQQFEIDLQGADLSYIIGGFVFSASWDKNPDGITFYLDDIRFEK